MKEKKTAPCVALHEYLTFCLKLITVKLNMNMLVNLNGVIINILRLAYCFGPTDMFCLPCFFVTFVVCFARGIVIYQPCYWTHLAHIVIMLPSYSVIADWPTVGQSAMTGGS